jgi:hypothetical protein
VITRIWEVEVKTTGNFHRNKKSVIRMKALVSHSAGYINILQFPLATQLILTLFDISLTLLKYNVILNGSDFSRAEVL